LNGRSEKTIVDIIMELEMELNLMIPSDISSLWKKHGPLWLILSLKMWMDSKTSGNKTKSKKITSHLGMMTKKKRSLPLPQSKLLKNLPKPSLSQLKQLLTLKASDIKMERKTIEDMKEREEKKKKLQCLKKRNQALTLKLRTMTGRKKKRMMSTHQKVLIPDGTRRPLEDKRKKKDQLVIITTGLTTTRDITDITGPDA